MDRRLILGLPLAGLALLAACSEPGPLDPAVSPAFNHTGDPAPYDKLGHWTLCKEGTDASFNVNVDGTASTVDLEAGTCTDVALTPIGGGIVNVTVTEIPQPGVYMLDEIVLDTFDIHDNAGSKTITGTNTFSHSVTGDQQVTVTFYNSPVVPLLGRMTGGGNPKIDGVNFGLTLHCDITLSNNLEINWDGGNWHLDKPITSALCLDDPAIDPTMPAAGFDTFIGDAIGRLDGVDGSYVRFVFVDAGEPGRNDTVAIQVWAVDADPSTDLPILDVSGNLTHGNLQAHRDQPHGDHG